MSRPFPPPQDDPDDRRRTLRSRLLLGTGGFPSLELMAEAIAASGSELVTVALRRVASGRAHPGAR